MPATLATQSPEHRRSFVCSVDRYLWMNFRYGVKSMTAGEVPSTPSPFRQKLKTGKVMENEDYQTPMNCIGSVWSELNSRMWSEPEVNGVETDECVGQQPRLLSQHDCSIIITPPTIKDTRVNINSRSLKTSHLTGGSRQASTWRFTGLQRVCGCVDTRPSGFKVPQRRWNVLC